MTSAQHITNFKLNLTPQSSDCLQKLTVSWLAKKLPTFYGTWRFITVFTRAHLYTLSWAS